MKKLRRILRGLFKRAFWEYYLYCLKCALIRDKYYDPN